MAADERENNLDPNADNSQDTDSVLNVDQPNSDLKAMDKKQGSFGYVTGLKHKSSQQPYTSERDLLFSKKDKKHGPSPTKGAKDYI